MIKFTHSNEDEYLALLEEILSFGEKRKDRTGTGTLSLFGKQLEFYLNDGETFPLLTTKKVFWKGVVEELLWMLRGETNIKSLNEKGVHIWDQWANWNGDLGYIYGKQWRDIEVNDCGVYREIDQIKKVITSIKENPYSRRNIVSAWNVSELDDMALPPCHMMFQFYVGNDGLSCHMYQRSADMFLGVPFNIASYALLTEILATICNLKTDKLIISYGDVHIYKNHIKQVKKQLNRIPNSPPKLQVTRVRDWPWEYTFDDFLLTDYNPHKAIKGEVSV